MAIDEEQRQQLSHRNGIVRRRRSRTNL